MGTFIADVRSFSYEHSAVESLSGSSSIWRISGIDNPVEVQWTLTKPVAPVAYQVILKPGIGQFREFASPRVYTRINS